MLNAFGQFQSLVLLALLVAGFALKAWALADALRQRADAFPLVGRLTKNVWLAILVVALAVNVVVQSPLDLLNLIGAVAAIVYLVDTRPKLRQVRGGSGHAGPYGPW